MHWLLVVVVFISACNDSEFKGASQLRKATIDQGYNAEGAEIPLETTISRKEGEALVNHSYAFSLEVAGGAEVIRPGLVDVVPSVFNNITQRKILESEAASWQVRIQNDGNSGSGSAALAPQKLDLSDSEGLAKVSADFSHSEFEISGKAEQSIFVDGVAPRVTLLRISDSKDGNISKIAWSATDNYKLDETKLVLLVCAESVPEFTASLRTDLDKLPPSCGIISSGLALAALSPELELSASALKIANLLPRNARFALYAEDMVGLSAFTWIAPAAQDLGLLSLTASPGGLQYTNQTKVSGTLKLLDVKGGESRQIELEKFRAEWMAYSLEATANPVGNSPAQTSFSPSVALQLGPTEGLHAFIFSVKEGGRQSNLQNLSYIYDKTPPLIDSIRVALDKAIPSAGTKVTVSWSVIEINGVAAQTIELKLKDTVNWEKLADLAAGDRSYTFDWGSRESRNFELRIAATDRASNKGSGLGSWARQSFNAAVITKSVNCYFCHMRIEGDLGGIDFPAQVHQQTGLNFEVTGKIYGTNAVPPLLAAAAPGRLFPNYDNKPTNIFPKDKLFPTMDIAGLRAKVKGTLKLGARSYVNVHSGNLVLDGSQSGQPIEISGEVLIDGDLIIKGVYKGIGTIYARNIYIVDDLTANSSAFPFGTDPIAAEAKAKASVVEGKHDGLYLGALGQVVVGVVNNRLSEVDVKAPQGAKGPQTITKNPFAWISQGDYERMGRRAVRPKDIQGRDINLDGQDWFVSNIADNVHIVEVSRVDAYIYAQELFSWRAYGNILLNGGFMSPHGGIAARVPEAFTDKRLNPTPGVMKVENFALNPRNGMPVDKNVIRYDYRLRVGGSGFETLKGYFDHD